MEQFLYNSYSTYGLFILKLIFSFFIIRALFRASVKEFHSNWNTLIDGFNYSTNDFYELLKTELKSNGIKNLYIHPVYLKEGGLFSARRKYLRVEWKQYRYDVCGAPFGNGFFISWWLMHKKSFGEIVFPRIPFVGNWIAKRLYKKTYYKIDTGSMFMTYAQASVLKVVDEITKENGFSLTAQERKPVMVDIFKR